MTSESTADPATPPNASDVLPLPVVLFDGDCGLCDKSVQFILDHDRQEQFHFTPLQSEYGKAALERAGLAEDFRESLVLVDDAGVHTHSTAVARIARRLDGAWKLLGLMRWVPRSLRDFGYRFVAKRRFRWFGRADVAESCRMLPPEQRARIVL